MAVPYDPTGPALLTEDERLDEVAAILSTGVRRTARSSRVLAHSPVDKCHRKYVKPTPRVTMITA